ncbi:hypothetical protein ACKUSY_18175, partial [Myroides odoratus]
MEHKIKVDKMFFTICSILSLGGSFYMTENLVVLFYLSLVSALGLILLYMFNKKRKAIEFRNSYDFLTILFSFIIVIVGFYSHNTESRIYEATGFLCFVSFCIFLLAKKINVYSGLRSLFLSNLAVMPLILLVPIGIYGFQIDEYGGYKGIFYNSNSYGGIAATYLCVAFSVVLPSLLRKSKFSIKYSLYLFLTIIPAFYLLILSGSRTSILSVFFCCFIVALMELWHKKKRIF